MIRNTDIAVKSMLAEHTGECTGTDAYTVDVHFKVYNIAPGALSESLAEIIARVEGEEEKPVDESVERNKYIAEHFLEICEKAEKKPDFVNADSFWTDVGRKAMDFYWDLQKAGLL